MAFLGGIVMKEEIVIGVLFVGVLIMMACLVMIDNPIGDILWLDKSEYELWELEKKK